MDLAEAMRADYLRLAEDVRAVRDRLDDVQATAQSPDGLVAVTVNGRGELVGVELDQRVHRELPADELAAAIVATARAAAVLVDRAATELTERVLAR